MPLPPGYSVREAAARDVDAVAALGNALSQAARGFEALGAGWLRRRWSAPGAQPADTFIVERAGVVVGYASVASSAPFAAVDVHLVASARDAARIGAPLLAAAERRARRFPVPSGERVLHGLAVAGEPVVGGILAAGGYRLVRTVLLMRLVFEGEVAPAGSGPAGLRVARADPAADLEAVYDCVAEAFVDHWGAQRRSFADWRHALVAEGAAFDLWWLGWAGDDLAGVVIGEPRAVEDATLGYVRQVAVRRAFRRRGIADHLLRVAIADFADRGCRGVALHVDAESETGATRLYERAGMVAEPRFAVWERRSAATADLSATR